ncbi:antitoxin Xre-like helix-turn-helix domain-containing protein [Legionella sp. 16cNR16C]|uniref:antitoxin Xre-like helix-turn-helix domain-containing protein n=1 Tax=Legionella sp. 16cNR16C TaxID=2905656 RepID=UPI001E51C151|nr:antitoxin Xre-like helix-turn-helix domain-containing protein [Legionella sp. 16cNR16C]MCE3043711.1 MbcA/ParS/Xre antitoxin family protein [Legionella sp. 16cNR16C]
MKVSVNPAVIISDGVAWKSLKNLMERFHFDTDEARILMGDMAASTYYKGINKLEGRLSKDEKERISLLLGIYKDLRILFIDSEQATSWIERANSLPPFNGKTPREFMLDGSLLRLADVRRFLDYWRGY